MQIPHILFNIAKEAANEILVYLGGGGGGIV